MSSWEKEFGKVIQCPQRQDSTTAQLEDLYTIAIRFGLYDASDAIKGILQKNPQPGKLINQEIVKMKSFTEVDDEIQAAERTITNYRKAFAEGEIERPELKRALAENQTTIAALRWVLGENDRFD